MDAAEDARYRIRNDIETDIQGFDIDGDVIKSARENAKLAGVDHLTISSSVRLPSCRTRKNTVF